MSLTRNYRGTICACFVGYIVQAIVNNFAPLLFVTFQTSFGVSLDRIALLVTFNFGIQLLVDLISPALLGRIGYRAGVIAAHLFAAAGLAAMALLPAMLPDPYVGILCAVTLYAVGGGLIEVLVSPIVEACPTDNKEAAMSLLHSFYCWGQAGVVLLSTGFFLLLGVERWPWLSLIWALVPLANAFLFARVPVPSPEDDMTPALSLKALAARRVFWLMLVLMLCAGACEQAVSQWASAFAEQGLGVVKAVGDLAGPTAFALLMGMARLLFSKCTVRLSAERALPLCAGLCLVSYLLASLPASPVLGLLGCALCGFSVGILWPATFSLAAARIRGGGTAMFAFLALAGDLGCSAGPALVGLASGALGGNLRLGILCAAAFPVLLRLALLINHRMGR